MTRCCRSARAKSTKYGVDPYWEDRWSKRHCTRGDRAEKEASHTNLYCLQWCNVEVDATATGLSAVPIAVFKIGRGRPGRENQVHAQNPLRMKVVEVWPGKGHLEASMHKTLAPYKIRMGAGREWFFLPFLRRNEDVSSFMSLHLAHLEAVA